MPNHQFSSLPQNFQSYPYTVWRELATTSKDYLDLLNIFRGIPQNWIEWTEKRVRAISKRVKITNPLEYRLTVLWNGIISLQECKFICDTLENGFRQSIIEHTLGFDILNSDIEISNWKKHRDKYCYSLENTEISRIILNLSFGELIQTMDRNWDSMKRDPNKKGFKYIFRRQPKCQLINVFSKDMELIRKYRNLIAHSNKLLTLEETSKIYSKTDFWLTPLQVDLKHRVLKYRSKRPQFLQDLIKD